MSAFEEHMRDMEKQMAMQNYGGYASTGPPTQQEERVFIDPRSFETKRVRYPVPDSIKCEEQAMQKPETPKPNKLLLLETP